MLSTHVQRVFNIYIESTLHRYSRGIQVDGSRDHLARAVQGAVDEFARAVNRQVFVVYEERHDDMYILKDYPNFPTWLIRK
jgi:hypothetical protein